MTRGRTYRFRRRLILIACIATALILGLAAIVAINASSYRQYNDSTRHSHLVVEQILGTSNALRSAESGLRGYLLTGDAAQLETFLTQLPVIDEGSARLVQMTTGNAGQHRRATTLRASMLARSRHMELALQRYREAGKDAALALLHTQLATGNGHSIAAQTDALRLAEQDDLLRIEEHRARSASLTAWFTVACLSSALVLMLSAVVLVIREQRNTLDSKEALMQAYLQLAQSLEESRGMADRMQRLHVLSETLQNCRSMHEALDVLPPSLEDMLPDTSGAVLLVNASHNLVETAAAWGDLPLRNEPVFAPDDCYALRRGQPYPDTDMHAKIPCAHLHVNPGDAPDTSWLCIPLLAQGETLGVLHLQSSGPMGPEMLDLSVTLGEQLGLLLGNLKLQESLRIQSIRDPLTGLFNRRYLESSLRRELLRNARHGRRLTLLMLDLDHFKQFNDVHGHDAGDELLQQFARMLREQIRAEDIACRYGGEEFTVILPETDEDTGLKRAQDIRARTAELKVRHRGALLGGISVSIGLASQDELDLEPQSLLHAADQALYRAKRAGRNRVEVAGSRDRRPRPEDTD